MGGGIITDNRKNLLEKTREAGIGKASLVGSAKLPKRLFVDRYEVRDRCEEKRERPMDKFWGKGGSGLDSLMVQG